MISKRPKDGAGGGPGWPVEGWKITIPLAPGAMTRPPRAGGEGGDI